MPSFDLEWRHPNLARDGYRITSAHSLRYNCVAWALGETHRWYQAGREPNWYWPDGVLADGSLSSYVDVFVHAGFEPCDSREWEPGCEKIAIYANEDGDFTHVAKMIDAETWTSKVGQLDDIEHRTVESLEDERFGTVVHVLRRQNQRSG
jgi:hypothetical protein